MKDNFVNFFFLVEKRDQKKKKAKTKINFAKSDAIWRLLSH